nr:hypothetical protein Itr_chr06CG07720 [Ipomoea trifida]GMD03305.1 hypothetical protein Iba_chr06aCG7630 [Ipomoea batatas]GMD03306.1 hypothetical protein Iba_chr06aCG7640 [Ipomoea batatas]GMD07465.1 hypothetical protein Iba_chr06cCG7490 [Ipomoea batatas]
MAKLLGCWEDDVATKEGRDGGPHGQRTQMTGLQALSWPVLCLPLTDISPSE